MAGNRHTAARRTAERSVQFVEIVLQHGGDAGDGKAVAHRTPLPPFRYSSKTWSLRAARSP